MTSNNDTYSIYDDLFIVQHAGILSKGLGNDTYIFSPYALAEQANIQISDSQGNNTLQFIEGLEIASCNVAASALQLITSTGSTITILNSPSFEFVVGGNPIIGQAGTSYSYADFVENVIGIELPTTGLASAPGFTITAEQTDLPDNAIEITLGEQTTYSGVEGEEDAFTFDVTAAQELTADTQITLENFDTTQDTLEVILDSVEAGTYDLQTLADTTDITAQVNPFTNSTLVNFGMDADGTPVTVTFTGITEISDIEITIT